MEERGCAAPPAGKGRMGRTLPWHCREQGPGCWERWAMEFPAPSFQKGLVKDGEGIQRRNSQRKIPIQKQECTCASRMMRTQRSESGAGRIPWNSRLPTLTRAELGAELSHTASPQHSRPGFNSRIWGGCGKLRVCTPHTTAPRAQELCFTGTHGSEVLEKHLWIFSGWLASNFAGENQSHTNKRGDAARAMPCSPHGRTGLSGCLVPAWT